MKHFGEYIRQRREKLRARSPEFSLRKVAARIEVEPSFLSKVERGEQARPATFWSGPFALISSATFRMMSPS